MQTMTVTDILRTATSSCDFSSFDGSPQEWMRLIQEKANDTGFGRLIDSILENGWETGSAIGFDGAYISEGHHRLAAAILLGLDEIPIAGWGSSPGTVCAHDEQGGVWREFDLFDVPPAPEWSCNITDCEYC